MVDAEVENTLREIRERVRKSAEFEAEPPRAFVSSANALTPARNESAGKTPETIARIDAHLTTTARAWDRLPPLVSNRSGGLARLELWVKRRLKQATRWYSWEQINFNAAVHHALRDTLDALLDLEKQLAQLRAEMSGKMAEMSGKIAEMSGKISADMEALSHKIERHQQETRTQRAAIESALSSQRAEIEASRTQMQAQQEAKQEARSMEVNARLADLARELRERDSHRLDEQRVSFKQLSLEITEAQVLLDRTRRDLESRLDKLESRKRKS